LYAAGIGAGSIRHRVSRGTLHVVLPSVLAVGNPVLEMLGPETAALLYAGDDCVLSHETAAALWGFCPAQPPEVSVTVIGRKVRQRDAVRVYRVQTLDTRDVRLRHGFPVTAPARTLIDVAGREAAGVVERALNEARVLKLVTDPELQAAIERTPLRTGVGLLRALMAAERGPAMTRSELERRLRMLLGQGQLPWPLFNVPLLGSEVDAVCRRPSWCWRWTGTRLTATGRRSSATGCVTSGWSPTDTW
jgi:hypothetical protein